MSPCSNDKSAKVDFVIPTRDEANKALLRSLSHMSCVGEIIITKERPLSVARKRAVLRASTEWVAMVDDDVILPKNWLERVTAEIAPNVGAVATVAVHKNRHAAAYERVVGSVVELNKVDTSPHINNVLVRKSLLANYNPPLLFFGEDQHLKKFIESTGHVWKVLPFIGATHLGSSKNHVAVGIAYRRYGHYSVFQLTRRVIARFILTPSAALSNFSLVTFVYLNRINVQFIAGWLKESLQPQSATLRK